MSPRQMAAATRCARVLVPVLAIALRTCVLTVSVVTNRSSAISRLVASSAMRLMISTAAPPGQTRRPHR